MDLPFIWFLKAVGFFSKVFVVGAGSTWPGHIMLALNPSFIKQFQKKFKGKIVVIAGTNGKTTTSKMIRTILEANGEKVLHNEAGANLLNGIASAIITATTWNGALPNSTVFEIDENSLPFLLDELTPDILVVLNLFRDQLDRYGEVNTISLKWKNALTKLPKQVTVILNADDPHVAYLGEDFEGYSSSEAQAKSRSLRSDSSRQARTIKQIYYFGVEDKKLYLSARPYAMDASFCPRCGERLLFEGIYLGHLGNWYCESCGLKRPRVDYKEKQVVLPGVYNLYNVQATVLVARKLKISDDVIEKALKGFTPAFGRQEEFAIDGKKVKIFLSKNPTGFNESLRTVRDLGVKNMLLVLNDRIPDGRDVSWIWDVDFEEFINDKQNVVVSGDRCYDMALRLKYGELSAQVHANLNEAIERSLKQARDNETLYILPTYSAMLEVRKILTGRKIL